MFTFLYDKYTQDNMYQILSKLLMFRRLYIKKHFGVFFGSQCMYHHSLCNVVVSCRSMSRNMQSISTIPCKATNEQ